MITQEKNWLAARCLFYRFWEHLGSILGGFWRPSWSHVGTKWHQNVISKPIKKTTAFWEASRSNFNGFLVDFGCLLGGLGRSNERLFWWLVGSWSQDAPKMPPRAPQDAPRAPQELNFGRFLIDLGWIFEGFLVDFLFILGSSSSSKRLNLANDMFHNSGIFWMIFECLLDAVGFIFGSSFTFRYM